MRLFRFKYKIYRIANSPQDITAELRLGAARPKSISINLDIGRGETGGDSNCCDGRAVAPRDLQ